MRPSTTALRLPAAWQSIQGRSSISELHPRPRVTTGRIPIPHLQHPRRPASNVPSSSRSALHDHEDFLEFKPPPISARLRPLIPFFIYWCMITSLAVHLLRTRISSKEELDKAQAQISVLEGLMERFKQGERVSQDEMRRELEMVGLRERVLTKPEEGEGGDVGWFKAIFGRRGVQDDEQKAEEDAVEQWAKVVNEATSHPTLPPASPASPTQPERTGSARRAPSSTVYM